VQGVVRAEAHRAKKALQADAKLQAPSMFGDVSGEVQAAEGQYAVASPASAAAAVAAAHVVARAKGTAAAVAVATADVAGAEGQHRDGAQRRLNAVAVVALQSGDAANPTPFWDLGIQGQGEFVQVNT
jgi:hypothetical protein